MESIGKVLEHHRGFQHFPHTKTFFSVRDIHHSSALMALLYDYAEQKKITIE
jgi:hypothetical protein